MSNDLRMFNLREVLPGLRGQLADFVEAPLRRGVALTRQRLAYAGSALIEYRMQFDYDSMWDSIGLIQPFGSTDEAEQALPRLIQKRVDELIKHNPTWCVIDQPVHAADILPATGTRLSERFPWQVGGAAVGNASVYDKVYLRYYSIDAMSEAILDQLARFSGLQEALVDYLKEIGAEPPSRSV